MTLPATIPLRREPDASTLSVWPGDMTWLSLVLTLLVFAWLGWLIWRRRRSSLVGQGAVQGARSPWARFFEPATNEQALKVMASARLTPNHSVHEVRWQGQRYLVACAAHNVCLLAEATAASPASEGNSSGLQDGGAPT